MWWQSQLFQHFQFETLQKTSSVWRLLKTIYSTNLVLSHSIQKYKRHQHICVTLLKSSLRFSSVAPNFAARTSMWKLYLSLTETSGLANQKFKVKIANLSIMLDWVYQMCFSTKHVYWKVFNKWTFFEHGFKFAY